MLGTQDNLEDSTLMPLKGKENVTARLFAISSLALRPPGAFV